MVKRRKLSDIDVSEIRQAILRGESNVDLAARFEVSASLISHIKRGRKRR